MDRTAEVVVVGAGAAGLACAIFAARANPALRIVVLDGARKVGAKILVSGGGRCNVTNVRVTPADFYGGNPHVLRRVLAAFSEVQARRFFEEIGVPLHEEEYGKLFPDSNQARTVVDALLAECQRLHVDVRTQHRVTDVTPGAAARVEVPDAAGARGFTPAARPHAFRVIAESPEGCVAWQANNVVLATGGRSLPKTGSDGFGYELARRLGHDVTPTVPALDPLVLSGDAHAELSGVTHDVELTIHVAGARPVRIRGPMLWTHFGVSGPAALNASRLWNRAEQAGTPVRITINLLDGLDFAAAEHALIEACQAQPRAQVSSVLRRWLPASVAEAACRWSGLASQVLAGQLPREARRRLLHVLTEWPLPVVGTRGYRYAEVTSGGVPLHQIDPSTMASRMCPGLHLVGEILDVDGRLGGFNFQWAWSSGYVAGAALARWA
ncbi:MAG: NAD(P)/FAD-dependent oxidoreductase [Phycisphaerales bacterium]|nr:MAG: NAD(P)/FAD-dependent oxidoreductase [Phycisphaerales bacterium]